MKEQLQAPTWLGRTISDPEHAHELERGAAVHEFHHKRPRHEAEQAAYEDYVRDQRGRAAAHHLRALKAAHAAGDAEVARKHHAMYSLHMNALGHDPHDRPPPAIEHLASAPEESLSRFRAHKGDLFALDEGKKDEPN